MSQEIIVVDDERGIREVFGPMLTTEGYVVQVFAAAKDALDYILTHNLNIHLLISDIQMPGMSGIDLVLRLKKMGITMPIIFHTASDVERSDLEKRGLDPKWRWDIIHKPTRFPEVLAKVREVISLPSV